MEEDDGKQAVLPKELLKKYLSQYNKKRKRKRALEKRLQNFKYEMLGAKAVRYSSTPKSTTYNITDEPIDFCIKCEEIEGRIEKERKEAATIMTKIIDILDFLPANSIEKDIMEFKYLDDYSWETIVTEASMCRSRCIDYWNMGLDMLLKYKKVQSIIENYSVELERHNKGA